jgi:hypothetical protein
MLAYKLVHAEAPALAIWRELGQSIEAFDIAAQGVLIATYKRPDDIKTSGNVLLPHQVVKDDEFQSKVGLVVKLGRRAFEDDEHVQWHGFRCAIGDWVVFRASDGMKMEIPGPGGVHCRLMADVYCKMKVPHADAVF